MNSGSHIMWISARLAACMPCEV